MTFQTEVAPTTRSGERDLTWVTTRRLIGGGVSALGALDLAAWVGARETLLSTLRSGPAMAGGAALGLLLLGVALLAPAISPERGVTSARLAAGLTILLGLSELALRQLRAESGMSLAAAIGMLMAGAAILFATSRLSLAWIGAQVLAGALGLGAFYSLTARLLSSPEQHAVDIAGTVALPVVLSFFFLAVAILLWTGGEGPLAALTRGEGERAVSRRLLVVALVAPALIAWLGLDGFRAGLFGALSALTVGLFLTMALFALLIWRKAYVYEGAERERRASLVELGASERRYRSLFESIPRPMWVYALDTMEFLAVNEAAIEHYGYSRDEFAHMTLKDIRPPEDLLALERDVVEGAGKGMTLNQLWRHRKKDGTVIDVEINSQRLDFLGRPARLVLAEDVTEKRRLEEAERHARELEEQSLRAREASRLKSEFLANMSHELRTPLNSIIGFAELLHLGKLGPVPEEHREYLGDILTSARHLLQLINDILDLAKIEAGKSTFRPEVVDLAATVAETRDIVRGLSAGRRIQVEAEIDPAIGPVVTDPAKLKQVLYNFLSNAIKFTPEGGRVVVRVQPESDEQFRVEVEDSGIGIREADLPKLFTEFEQLDAGKDKHYAGTGLGLALTRKIVEAQGGRVGVESELGRGSRFFAVLPRQPRAAESRVPSGREEVAPTARMKGPTILVVDDSESDRKWLRAALEKAGYRVEAAMNGHEALELCHRRRYAGITLDLLLPDMSGWDLLRGIRSGEPNAETPVVVVTVVTEKTAGRGFLLHDFLVKPVRESDLVASLARAGVRPGPRPVLVVEDDPAARRLADAALGALEIETMSAASGEEGLEMARRRDPAAVVLDLRLPSMDGFEFLAQFRARESWKDVPVIVWTIKDLTDEDTEKLRETAQAVVAKGSNGASELARQLSLYLPASNRSSEVPAEGESGDGG